MTYPKCYIADGCGGDEACAALCPNTRIKYLRDWMIGTHQAVTTDINGAPISGVITGITTQLSFVYLELERVEHMVDRDARVTVTPIPQPEPDWKQLVEERLVQGADL